MGRAIVKLHDPRDGKDWYVEWSTIVDAPVTYLLTRDELREHISRRGMDAPAGVDERLKRADETGTSWRPSLTVEETIAGNRAGQNEECLSLEEILDQYSRDKS